MTAKIVIAIATTLGLILSFLLSRYVSGQRMYRARLVVFSAMSAWLFFLIAAGFEGGLFVVLLTAFFLSGAVKAGLDLDANRSGTAAD